MHSRGGCDLLAGIAVVALAAAWFINPGSSVYPECLIGGIAGLLAALATCSLTALVLQLTNRRFNMFRADTSLPAALFLTMLAALPPAGNTFGTGNILALTMTASAYLLFTTYADPMTRRRVFLMFAVVTALAMTSIVYLYYIPVLLIGCIQMRIFSLKTVLAALLGIITPPWIALGSGLVSLDSIEMPEFSTPMLNLESPATVMLLAVAAVTIIAGVAFTCANLIKVYSYNSQTRAMNGFYTIMFLATTLLTIIDFNNLPLYVPLLMAMAACQASHFFVVRATMPRSWVGIAVLIAVYWGAYILYTWFIPTSL